MSYGINYKFNGLLHHNIHRVWIITKVVVPKLNDVKFPDINFNPNCTFLKQLKYTHVASKHVSSNTNLFLILVVSRFTVYSGKLHQPTKITGNDVTDDVIILMMS